MHLTDSTSSPKCCCFVDSLTLPVYALFDPNPSLDDVPPCICGIPISRLIKEHGDTLMREEGEGGLTYASTLKDEEQRSGSSTPAFVRGRSGMGGRELLLRQDSGDY